MKLPASSIYIKLLIETDSELPRDLFYTDQRLENVNFDEAKLLSFMRALNVNKAHG